MEKSFMNHDDEAAYKVPNQPGSYALGYQEDAMLISGMSNYTGHRLAIWRAYLDNTKAQTVEIPGRGVDMTLVWVLPGCTGLDLVDAEVTAIEHGGKVSGRGKLHNVPLTDNEGQPTDVPFVDFEFGPADRNVLGAVRALLQGGYLVHAARLIA